MNLLSMLSVMLATAFLIGSVYCLTRNRKAILNVLSFLVLFSLGWWNFCNAFFFSSETVANAWFWHKLASLGWVGFAAATTYYFIVLTGSYEKLKKIWIRVAFFILPVVLLVHNLFASTTSIAQDLIKSRIGGQWAYINSANNVWLWLYLLYVLVYFGISFFLLLRWSSNVKHRMKRKMARSFVLLDGITILLGFITDILSPLTTQAVPSIANLCSAFFCAGYFLIIIRYDLFNIHLVVPDREIIRYSTEPLIVTDEQGEILDANAAATLTLTDNKQSLIGKQIQHFFADDQYRLKILKNLLLTGVVGGVELTMYSEESTPKRLLASAAFIKNHQQDYLGTVVSLRDITQLSVLKEKYKKQSDQYHLIAFTDTLTGLPNRRKTFDVLKESAQTFEKDKTDFFVLYMDIDYFKEVNDQFGHQVGDEFLIKVAKRLDSCLYEDLYFLGRLSGDEFLIIGGPDTSDQVISACQAQVLAAFQQEFIVEKNHIESSITMGSARYSDHDSIDAMIHCADSQMYMIKRKYHSHTRLQSRKED